MSRHWGNLQYSERPVDLKRARLWYELLDEDYLILSTIHFAKGQEWKSVYLLNVVEGCMPSDLGAGTSGEIEDERRLLYVAMTCAKDDLHLVVPRRFAPEAGVAGNSLRYEGNADDERSAAAGGRNLTE